MPMSQIDLETQGAKPGDALRDEAARLLSFSYGQPKREVFVNGKKVDVCFEYRHLGKNARLYVEAKDYAGNLDHDDVNKIWADYSGIIETQRPAALLLVSRNGLTPGAQALVDRSSDFRHQTIRELETEALGLTEYVRSLATLFDEDALRAYYIETRAIRASYDVEHQRLQDGEPVELFDAVQKWIRSGDHSPVAILGGYGEGKSSFAKRLVAAQAEAVLANPLERHPVLIRLGSLVRYSSVESLLGGLFTYDFPVSGFNVHHFLNMNLKGRLLIVLDGFDEMKHAMSFSDFRSQIKDLNKLVAGAAKIVLLGRPAAFMSMEEHFHVLRGLKRHEDIFYKLPDWPEFVEYDLIPFSHAERTAFVMRYLAARAAHPPESGSRWVEERAEEVNRLADIDAKIFEKPVHAKILTDLATDARVDLSRFKDGVSRWGLYDTFFTMLAEREMEKPARRPIGEKDRRAFAREVAYWLWTKKGGATSFSAGDMPLALMELLSQGDAAELEDLKREYLSGSLLEKKGGDTYYFGHRSFAEFLVAERMIAIPPNAATHQEYSQLTRDGVRGFLSESPAKNFADEWAKSLPSATGEIHIEYLDFIARTLGGLEQLVEFLPKKSVWTRLISVFNGELTLRADNISRILMRMRVVDQSEFFLFLTLLQRHAPLDNKVNYEAATAAAILDRVFAKAEIDWQSSKVAVDPTANEARQLGQSVLPALSANAIGDRRLKFNGSRLVAAQAEGIRKAGFHLIPHPPHAFRGMTEDRDLPWAQVLAHLATDRREDIEEYFRYVPDWRGIFTRQTRDPRRSVKRPNT